MQAPLPPNEPERLAALFASGLLDTAPEQAFDDLVSLAAQICGTPLSAVSLVDTDRQWFKARVGIADCQTERAVAFCAHAILDPTRPLIVPDTTLDPRFADSALVTGEPFIRFYAGVPLVTREGLAIGSLCVKDTVPRTLAAGQVDALVRLARQVMRLIESRQLLVELAEQKAALDQHAIVVVVNTAGNVTHANDRFGAIAQCSPDSLRASGSDIFSARHPGHHFFRDAMPTVTRGTVWRGEVHGRSRGGSDYWVETTVVPVKNAGGRPWQYVAIGTDITERKRGEDLLQRQQAEMRVLFDLIPAMIWFKDTRNGILRINERAATAAGKAVEDIEGRPTHEVYPDMAAKFYADDLAVIASRKPKVGIVETILDRNGREVWIQTDKVPYFDAEGNIVGVVVMAQDISERRRTDELLRLLGSAIEQCQESIVITDVHLEPPGPCIQFVNPAFTTMTGYTAAEALGQTTRIQQGPLTDRAAIERLVRTLLQGQAAQGESVSYRKDGTTFLLEWHVAPIRNGQGVVTHFVGIQRDITARRAAEVELKRAREEAEAASRFKSRFLANMSHELRTPLNTINGLSATLVEQDVSESTRQSAALILQCGETLLANIQTLLTHSALEAGRVKLETKPFRLDELVVNALRLTAPAARARNLEVDYYLDPNAPALLVGDPFRLQQIFINLLANAIKFTDRGRVFLRVRARARPAGVWELRCTVFDTGVGLTRADRGRLFKPFHQVDSSSTRRFEGTGLGLAISKCLVELMDGRIEVRSRLGRGSVFTVTVGLPGVAGASAVYAGGAARKLTGKRILIVETDPWRRSQLVAMTAAWQMRLVESSEVPAAGASIDFVLRRAPRAGLLSASGPEAGAAVQGVPVVWLSPVGEPPPPAGGGSSAVVTLPVNPLELRDTLVSLLTSLPGQAAAVPAARPRQKLGERLPLRILAADDIQTNRIALASICAHLGYQIDLVENGALAVEQVGRQAYDLLLLDVQMPVMDGHAAAAEIVRRHPDKDRRPLIVAVTASVQPEDREHCLTSGMDDYLAKPVLPKQLAACIEKHFSGLPRPAVALPEPPRVNCDVLPPLVDRAHLAAVTEGLDAETAAGFVGQLFLAARTDYQVLRPRLEEACRNRRAQDLAACVHGLKGCAVSLGWARLAQLCITQLAALRENRFTAWNGFTLRLDELFQASAAELRNVRPELAATDPAPGGEGI